jgi:phosphoserine phosphatase RsbU/P
MDMDKTATILIVDDDPMSVLILENLLRHEGFKTINTTIGMYTYPLARNKQPDLILLDVNLPGERGPEICRKLKAHPGTSEIPVLFLSAETDVASKIECFDAGGQDYITKPFEPKEAIARVKIHLRLQQTQKALNKVLSSKISEFSKAQQVLLPPKPSEFPEAKFAVWYQQLSGAGGDFYDVIKTGGEIFDYITADVCGHDHSIAFVTAALKSLIVQNSVAQNTPADVLLIVNKVIPSVLQSGQFVAISWVRINRLSKKALIVNAGQPPVIYLPCDKPAQSIDITGDIVGIFDKVVFEQKEIEINNGDRFILCSDGLVEAGGKSPESGAIGINNLLPMCQTNHGMALNRFVQDLVPSLLNGKNVTDDIVVLGVEV